MMRSTPRWMALALIFGGCVSLAAQNATRAPQGRSAAEIAQDEAQCEAYAKAQAKNRHDHYRVCMIARSYAANRDMDELGWTIGVVQTRPHDAQTVMVDMTECDRRADNAKKTDVVPPLTPEQESVMYTQARPQPYSQGMMGYEMYQQRPMASRMFAYCLQERGYAITPQMPLSR